jgi:PAS domain S-box-containing protein
MSDSPATVLLIEDNPGDARLIQEMLAEGGDARFKLARAEQLSSGLERLAANDIEVVLLDLGLPDSQGFDTFTKTYAQAPRVPIIVLSGLADEQLAIKTVQEGAQDYLVKGYLDSHALVRTIRYAIERKQTEEALRLSEEKYRLVVENAKEAIVITQDVKLVFVNRAGEDMIGYSKEILTSKPFTEFIHPDDRNMVVDHHIRRIKGEEVPDIYSFRVVSQDGTVKWVELNAAVIQWKERPATLNFLNDITDRKQAEEALRESQTRFRTLFEAIPDSVLVYDDEGTILHVNEIGARQLEWPAKDLVGRNLREIVPPENRALIADHIKEILNAGWRKFETTYVARSGWKIEVEVNDRRMKFNKRKAILRVARDITERKEAERALLREKDFSDTVMNSSPGLFFVFNDKGNIIRWNKNAEKVTGYSAKEISKMNILDFVVKEDQKAAAEAMQEVFTKGQSSIEIKILSKQGKEIPFYITGLRTKFENTTCVVCTGMDITERKQVETALRESEERFRIATETTNDVIYEWDLQHTLQWFGNIDELLGYGPGKFPRTMDAWTNSIHPEDQERVMAAVQAKLDGREPYAIEYRVRRLDGANRWWSARGDIVSTPDGKPIKWIGTITDITERKKAEEEVRRSYEQLHETLLSTVNALASTVEMKDRYTAGHQPRATQLACAIAKEMGLPVEQIEGIRMAASLHDIGKIVVPAEILNKPGPVTELQFEMIKMHPQAGYDILKGIQFPWPVAEIVLQHHERLDGSGYPKGLAGEEIMLEARILIVANVVEGMTAHRPYRPALSIEAALHEITMNRGVLYDPNVTDICTRLFTAKGFAFGQEI